MTEIQLFEVEGSRWRFGTDEAGRPWVVAADVAKALDYASTQKALQLVDEDEKGLTAVVTPGGIQQMWAVYEDGVWELIFRSSKPEAKPIKKRVKAILREIRETGSYAVQQMTPAEFLVYQAQQLLAQERRVRQLGQEVAEVTARVDGIEQRTGWYTALGYARLHGLPTDRGSLVRLGIAAGQIARAAGIEPVKVTNEAFGSVNSYPEEALAEAARTRDGAA